jgi:hypothetical protein
MYVYKHCKRLDKYAPVSVTDERTFRRNGEVTRHAITFGDAGKKTQINLYFNKLQEVKKKDYKDIKLKWPNFRDISILNLTFEIYLYR